MENKMPKDFFWGNSTSSMQTEGGWNEGGKGPSVYDVNTAGRSAKDWQVTNDNYHHYSQDLDLMKEMNMNMYRFQISWSRIVPDGDGEFNEEGIAFYNRLIDDLLARGIEPMICLYHFDITLTQEEFYKRLSEDADISTSQPSPGDVIDLWDEILKEYDEIVYIPMSSGLSSSCETAIGLSQDYDGKVHVIDNQRISITQRQSVLDALEMAKKGMSAQEIDDVLMREKLEASIYITVDTLKYLKKGGRVTPAAAAIGTVLNLKPVLQYFGLNLSLFPLHLSF